MTRSELAKTVDKQAARHPFFFLGGGLAAGFVVGGGLGSTLSGRLLRFGGTLAWRYFVLPKLTSTLSDRFGIEYEDDREGDYA